MKRKVALLLITLSLVLFVTPATAAILWADAPSEPVIPRDTLLRYQSDGIPYFLYLPSTASTARPLIPLLAIHAYGEDARGFVERMIPQADRFGWLLVAPDLPSGDWKDYQVIRSDARRNLPWLHNLVDSLPALAGMPVDSRVLIYGFSLGAQTGHRFTLAYPEHVLAAAVMSAGTYTLPVSTSGDGMQPLAFPLGTSDLKSYAQQSSNPDLLRDTRFWVGVGEADAAPGDVPREFDGYEGNCRKDRALSFARSLWSEGVPAEYHTFPGQAHFETEASLAAAMGFLFRVSQMN